MSEKLKFDEDCHHEFGYTGFEVGPVFTCSACGTKTSAPGGKQTLCPALLHQKLVNIKSIVELSTSQNEDIDTMAVLREMFEVSRPKGKVCVQTFFGIAAKR